MNRRQIIPLILLGFVVWLFWQMLPEEKVNKESSPLVAKKMEVQDHGRTDLEIHKPPEKLAKSERAQLKPPKTAKQQGLALQPQPETQAATRPNLGPGEVEFVVKNGLAIAFGDTIIGRAEEKFEGKRGVHKPEKSRLWPSNEIPYAIDEKLANPKRVEQAIEYFHQNTAIRFVPFKGQQDVIVFVPGEELCLSHLGRIGGQQPIYLAPSCQKQQILHEIMHALAFVHEQSRADRDRYIEIKWQNIPEEFHLQFAKVPEDWVHEYRGSVFDFNYESIMLYPQNAFAAQPGNVTMESITRQSIQPVTEGLSRIDLERLHYLYGL